MTIENMTFTDYLDHPGLSRSLLNDLVNLSPSEARYKQLNGSDGTKAFNIGEALHKIVLEGVLAFSQEYVCIPSEFKDKRAKGFKAFEKENPDVEILNNTDYALIQVMYDNMMNNSNEEIVKLNHGFKGEVEKTIIFSFDGHIFKIRPDKWIVNDDGSVVIYDLKSTKDLNPRILKRDGFKYGYAIQSFLYRLGLSIELGIPLDMIRFMFVYVGKDMPCDVDAYWASDKMILAGEDDFCNSLAKYKSHWDEEINFPSYTDGKILEMDAPEWKYNQMMANSVEEMNDIMGVWND